MGMGYMIIIQHFERKIKKDKEYFGGKLIGGGDCGEWKNENVK